MAAVVLAVAAVVTIIVVAIPNVLLHGSHPFLLPQFSLGCMFHPACTWLDSIQLTGYVLLTYLYGPDSPHSVPPIR